MRVPAWPVARAYLRRGLGLWACARALFAVVVLFSVDPAAARAAFADAPAAAAPAVVPLAVLLGAVDRRRWGQRVLLGNLGVTPVQSAALAAAAAGAGEAALAASLGALRAVGAGG